VRINTIGTPLVTRPDSPLHVGETRAVTPAQARAPGAGESLPAPLPAPERSPGAVVPVQADRRQQVRRGEERRTRQVAVLIDTRVAERRAVRRRAQDEAPPSIDIEA
jgi:hypothetical protein